MPVTNIFSFADLSCIFHIIAFLNPDCQKIDYIGLVGLLVFSYSQNAILRCLMFQQYSSCRPTILRNIDSIMFMAKSNTGGKRINSTHGSINGRSILTANRFVIQVTIS